jgi:predicted  nucleic acid-binding Zn-ribbon protein
LKREIAKIEEDVNRTEANISNSTRRHLGYQEIVRFSAEALEEATKEATEASQAVRIARARCAADVQAVEELRRISSDNPSILAPEMLQNIEENTVAQKQKRETELTLRKKEKRLNDLKNKIEIAKVNADPLQSKINELSGVRRAKENSRRSLVILHRLVAMGEKEMEEVLGEKGIEEWMKEQV